MKPFTHEEIRNALAQERKILEAECDSTGDNPTIGVQWLRIVDQLLSELADERRERRDRFAMAALASLAGSDLAYDSSGRAARAIADFTIAELDNTGGPMGEEG